jgi:hypothetical protein
MRRAVSRKYGLIVPGALRATPKAKTVAAAAARAVPV